MKVNWTKGLNPRDKEEMQQIFAASSRFRERAIVLLKEKMLSAQNKNLNEDAYENPNWALKQADSVGYARALREIISLMSETD